MVAMRGCDLHPFLFLVWITDSTTLWIANCLGDRLAPRWSNNLSSGDMLKGRPSSSATRSGLLWHCKAPSL